MAALWRGLNRQGLKEYNSQRGGSITTPAAPLVLTGQKAALCRLLAFFLILTGIYAGAARAEERRPLRNQLVRVVTISTDRLAGKGGVLEGTMERLNQAASFQPDIACLPEIFTHSTAEAVPGPTTARLGEW